MDIILKNRGNYKELLTFKKATVIYDLTYHFCHKYLLKGDRTIDQMIQAARSGKQNIAEGVAASSTNAETEIRLVNVAKASLKELLTDFEDYLRTRRLRLWNPAGEEIAWLRKFAVSHLDSTAYLEIADKKNDEVVANIAIALLKQEDYLLFRQLEAIERQYKENGDLRVRMKPVAKEALARNRDRAMKEAAQWGKRCPKCRTAMEDGTTATNGNLEPKWKCPKCGEGVAAGPLEIQMAQRAWRRRVLELKGIFGY